MNYVSMVLAMALLARAFLQLIRGEEWQFSAFLALFNAAAVTWYK